MSPPTRTGAWSPLRSHTGAGASRSGIYYQDLLAPGEPLARVAAASGRREAVAEFSAALRSGYHRCGFMDLAPDGSPLIAFNLGTANLHVATLELP